MLRLLTLLQLLLPLYQVYAQSIPSYWMNVYHLESYYATRSQAVIKIDVSVTGYYSSGTPFKEKWAYRIDSSQVWGKFHKDGELTSKFSYQFDSLQKIIKINTKFKHSLGWEKAITVYKYKQGKRMIEEHSDPRNHLYRHVRYEYDAKGNPTKLLMGRDSMTVEAYETAEYDYDKEVYTYRIFKGNGQLVSTEVIKCKSGNIAQQNEQGDLVRVVWPTSSTTNPVYHNLEYSYDEYGNWTKRIRTIESNGRSKTHSIVERKITYKK